MVRGDCVALTVPWRCQNAAGGLYGNAASEQLAGKLLAIAAPLGGLSIADVLGCEGIGSAVHGAA